VASAMVPQSANKAKIMEYIDADGLEDVLVIIVFPQEHFFFIYYVQETIISKKM
jgi:hypothetical protein